MKTILKKIEKYIRIAFILLMAVIRHTRAKGYLGDMEKYNSAQLLGYSVYRYSTEQVKSGMAIKEILKRIG